MKFDFDTPVERDRIGNMKDNLVKESPFGEASVMLSGAEMDYATAPVIRDALAAFAQRGIYGYTLPDARYKRAVTDWMKNVRGLSVSAGEIVPTLGTIFALNTAVRAFTDEGDGVIVQHPSYYRYDVGIGRNGRRVVSNPLIERDNVYEIDFASLERCMADKVNKLFVLCNPHNPTGKVIIKDSLERIAALSRKYNVIVFSDEIFAEITFDGHCVTPYCSVDAENSIVSTSLGKVFNFTGVNHANLIIRNEALREAYIAQRAKDHFGSIDPFFYEAVVAGYSREGFDWVQEMKAHTWENYRILQEGLAKITPRIGVSPLEGGFVVWVDMRALGLGDDALKHFLECEAGVVGDPGAEYGAGGSGFLRINIATPHERIRAFTQRLQGACAKRFR